MGMGMGQPAPGSDGRPCFAFQRGACINGSACKFVHEGGRPEGGARKVCQYFEQGGCNAGDRCRFLHTEAKPDINGGLSSSR